MGAFNPADEIEGMLAAQAVAMHHTAMECSRRAMIPDQPFEAAQGFRKAAASASRTFTELLSALDRKRGKGGQQKVTVEHVHVHAGGQAIVGAVTSGGGDAGQPQEKPGGAPPRLAHDSAIGTVLSRLRSQDSDGNSVSVPAMRGKKRCRLHGGLSTGPRTAEGIERIRKARTVHGRYSAEMRELRRMLATLRSVAWDAEAIE